MHNRQHGSFDKCNGTLNFNEPIRAPFDIQRFIC